MLRQLPLVGSVLNWFSPVQSSIKGRTFSLAAGECECVRDDTVGCWPWATGIQIMNKTNHFS